MDIEYLLALQDFREGAGQLFREFFMKMTFLTDKETSIAIVAIIYWCVSKEYGSWLWLGWSFNRLINGFLKVTACVYRPWIRDARIIPDAEAKTGATGYSFPSGHATNASSIFGSGIFYKKFSTGLKILFGLLLILCALSRNYLGVHTPQDVIVGLVVGLVVMYLISKLITWLDAHPEKEIPAAIVGISIAVAVAVYAGLKSYPVDYDENGKILVEGAKMANDTYKAVGWSLAVWIGRILDRRYVHFSTDVPLTDKIFRLVGGLLSFYAVSLVLCPALKELIAGPAGTVTSTFLQIFYIIFLFPLICVKLEEHSKVKARSN